MAPHDTDTPKEARRHAFPLAGMAIVAALVLVGFLWWVSKSAGLIGDAEPVPEGGIQGENTDAEDGRADRDGGGSPASRRDAQSNGRHRLV